MKYVKAGVIFVITLGLMTGISCSTTPDNQAELVIEAQQDHAEAQYKLGIDYLKGQGVPKNLVLAHMWLNLAATNGHDGAIKELAAIEKEMTASQVEVAGMLQRELIKAQEDQAGAQYKLGLKHLKGQGVPRNLVLAHMWLSLAATSGHKGAIKELAAAEEIMTTSQIEAAGRLQREWVEKQNE